MVGYDESDCAARYCTADGHAQAKPERRCVAGGPSAKAVPKLHIPATDALGVSNDVTKSQRLR